MNLLEQTGTHDLVPLYGPGFPAGMGMSVLPDKVRLPCIQIDSVYAEVLFAQGSDDLLNTQAGIIKLQALLQDIVYILDV